MAGSCSRPPPPFDVKFHRFVNLTVPAGVSVVVVEVAGAGGGAATTATQGKPGGDSECMVGGVEISAKGGQGGKHPTDGSDGDASITGDVELISNAFAIAGAGGGGGVAGGVNGVRGGYGGLAGAHIHVKASDIILCHAGRAGLSETTSQGTDGIEHGWVRVRW